MQPIDFRNETFDSIRERLSAQRLTVHRAWLAHGPGTTRDVAAKAQIDILSFRPRTTELYQIGLVMLITPLSRPSDTLSPSDGERDGERGHEGVYYPRTLEEWETWCQQERERVTDTQMKLI